LVIKTDKRIFNLDVSLKEDFFYQAKPNENIEIQVNDSIKRIYRGAVRVTNMGKELRVVNITPIEKYVAGVVAGEVGAKAEPELIKAHAILARTYALKKISIASLSDLAYHQVFKGYSLLAQDYEFYSAETADRVLRNGGKLADVMYHAECGSLIYHAGEYWPATDRYISPSNLPGTMSLGKSWQVIITRKQLETVFENANTVKRLVTVPVTIDLGNQIKNIESFRLGINRKYGWNTIASNEFTIQTVSAGWLLKGKGRGHLIGMCQQQANKLSQQGWHFDQLLKLFYPNYEIEYLNDHGH
jgi:stage II sporulation protein D